MGAEQANCRSENKEPLSTHKILEIIKEGSVKIQYGLKSPMHDCVVIVTNEQLSISLKHDDQKSVDTVAIQWDSLLNIDDLNNKKQLHYFQLLFNHKKYPIIYIYCNSKSDKKSWIKVFEELCPRFILTNELQSLKNCALNLGFNESQIEHALIKYHKQHGTVYNMNVFCDVILNNKKTERDEKKDHDNDDETEAELQCSICLQMYKNPVKHLHNKTYCYNCIISWFDIIKEDQTQIKDPYTRKPLPQHCRLLIPHFEKMAKVWDKQHTKIQQISEKTHSKLQNLDGELNTRRMNILNYLETVENVEQIATGLFDGMLESNKFGFDEKQLDNVITDMLNCQKHFSEIKTLIETGSKIYNDQIKRIVDNYEQESNLFKWKEPKWNNNIRKNCTNWSEVYQIDEYLVGQISENTREVMKNVTETLQQYQDEKSISTQQLKDAILNIILTKQQTLVTAYAEEEEKKDESIETEVMNKDSKYIKMEFERILYSETNGLVKTRCIQEIAECIKHKKAFELFHNDLNDKTMSRDTLIRFLETSGMGGIEDQYYIYDDVAMGIKYKMFQLKSYLNKLDNMRFKNYFPYFKYLKSVDILKQPVIDTKDWNNKNDKIELKVKFECDYDQHLAQYKGNKRELGKEIKRQMLLHLKLEETCKDGSYFMITNVQKGCIEAIFIFGIPLVGIIAGGYDCYITVSKFRNDPDFSVPWYRAMMQGALVGGGIAGVIAGAVSFTGVGAIGAVGIVIGGVVVGAMLGLGIWGYCNYKKKRRVVINVKNDNGPGYGDDINGRLQRANIQQPGGGWSYIYSGAVQNLNGRIKKNGEKYKITLDCYCEYDYDVVNEQDEGGEIFCKKCKMWTCMAGLKRQIHNNGNGNDRLAEHRVRVWSGNLEDNFNVDL